MPDSAHYQRLVEAAVQQAFDDARADLTQRVMRAIAPALAPPDNVRRLAAAVRTIEGAFAQTDILGALLNGCAGFATRCALFVARGVSAPMWQSSGFDAAAVRGVSAMVGSGLAATAMQSLTRAEGQANDFDSHFMGIAGVPANGKCAVLPLIVREKVAALVYADAGNGGECDADALEILIRAAGTRIEIASTRKPPVQAMAASATSYMPTAPTAPQTVGPAPEPAPSVATAAPAPAVATPAPAIASTAPAMAPAPAAVSSPDPSVTTAPEVAPQPAPAPSSVNDDPVHAKARRFAKLLVEEIKLYNQQQVAAGRQSSDLYTRLREPIDKSREAYDKRYASTSAADENYFAAELVRILADNNIALMGPNFPR